MKPAKKAVLLLLSCSYCHVLMCAASLLVSNAWNEVYRNHPNRLLNRPNEDSDTVEEIDDDDVSDSHIYTYLSTF